MLGSAGTLVASLGAALLMAAVHVGSPRLTFLDRTPRSIWLSMFGGVSVSYVFVHLLPELARMEREHLGEAAVEAPLYLAAVAGLVAYYGLEQMAKRHGGGGERRTPAAVFWLHLISFAIYNLLIGYLLDEQLRREGLHGMAVYAGAMGLHFLVNDRALYRHHGSLYTSRGRWLLAAAVLVGWTLGLWIDVPMVAVAGLIAFLAGSVVLNVIKEELPEERESRFWAFALGAASYAVLLTI